MNDSIGLPENSPACSVKFPWTSTAKTSVGKLCFCATCKPYSSCHGVILTAQDHWKESTVSSHIIGIFLFIIGIITFCHINFYIFYPVDSLL